MKKQSKNKPPKLPPGATVITHAGGRQVVVANPITVKAAMVPTMPPGEISGPYRGGKYAEKQKPLPGASESTQRVKDEVFKFAANGYPKILPYFTARNPHYKVAAKYLNPEDVLHIGICALIAEYFPHFRVSHAKNEGKESHVGQAKKVLMGIAAGFSDLMVQKPGTTKCLFMEIKVKPNRLTADQKEFLEFQADCGHHTAVPYDMQEALYHLKEFDKIV